MPTNIEWAEETWNPITGCSQISEGCANCYAARMANRLRGRCGYDNDEPFRVTVHLDRFDMPERWRKRRHVFVCSMGDLCHEDVPLYAWDKVTDAMRQAPQHTYILLTKRPSRLYEFAQRYVQRTTDQIPANWWLGVTAENQERANERIPILLQIPAAVRFVSVEPMLGPVDLSEVPGLYQGDGHDMPWLKKDTLHWVICGGETGPKARRMEYEWADGLRGQCEAEGVPFFFKKPGSAAKALGLWPRLESVRQFPITAVEQPHRRNP